MDKLGLDVLDLFLIHWPLPMFDQYVETWRAFEKLLGRRAGALDRRVQLRDRAPRTTPRGDRRDAGGQPGRAAPGVPARGAARIPRRSMGSSPSRGGRSVRARACWRTRTSSRWLAGRPVRRRRWCCAGTFSSAMWSSPSRCTPIEFARTSTSSISSSMSPTWQEISRFGPAAVSVPTRTFSRCAETRTAAVHAASWLFASR